LNMNKEQNVQGKFALMHRVWYSTLDTRQKTLLTYMISKADEATWKVKVTTPRLAQVCGYTYSKNFQVLPSSTRKGILPDDSLCEIVGRDGRRNIYRLNVEAIHALPEQQVEHETNKTGKNTLPQKGIDHDEQETDTLLQQGMEQTDTEPYTLPQQGIHHDEQEMSTLPEKGMRQDLQPDDYADEGYDPLPQQGIDSAGAGYVYPSTEGSYRTYIEPIDRTSLEPDGSPDGSPSSTGVLRDCDADIVQAAAPPSMDVPLANGADAPVMVEPLPIASGSAANGALPLAVEQGTHTLPRQGIEDELAEYRAKIEAEFGRDGVRCLEEQIKKHPNDGLAKNYENARFRAEPW
jgi:hypothetical protein